MRCAYTSSAPSRLGRHHGQGQTENVAITNSGSRNLPPHFPGAVQILRVMTNGNHPQNRAWGKAKASDFARRLAAASPCTQPPGCVQGDGGSRRQISPQGEIAPPTARLSSGGRSPSPQCAPRLGTPFAAGTQCPENDSPPLRGGEDVFGWRVQRQSVRQRGQAGGTPAQPQRGCPSAERAGAAVSKWWKRAP